MAYEKVDTQTWKPEKEGDFIEGIFVGSESNVGDNNAKLYHLEVAEKPIAVWGSVVLDTKMIAAKPGDKIKIVYLGRAEAKSGKNAAKLFDVFIDFELRKEMKGPAGPSEPEVGPATGPKEAGTFQA